MNDTGKNGSTLSTSGRGSGGSDDRGGYGFAFSMEAMYPEAKEVWLAAGEHINSLGDRKLFWLRNNVPLPHTGHLLFRYRNQLFSVFVDCDLFPLSQGSNRESFLSFAEKIRAVPCVFSMDRHLGAYVPRGMGWGLTHAVSGEQINPLEMATDELIEVSEAELHHLSVYCAKNQISALGWNVTSSNSFLEYEPGLIFDKGGETKWAVVRGLHLKELITDMNMIQGKIAETPLPADMAEINKACREVLLDRSSSVGSSADGIFIIVGFASVDFLTGKTADERLHRGSRTLAVALFHDSNRNNLYAPVVMMIEK